MIKRLTTENFRRTQSLQGDYRAMIERLWQKLEQSYGNEVAAAVIVDVEKLFGPAMSAVDALDRFGYFTKGTTAQEKLALMLRRQWRNNREIGVQMGLTPQRVHQILKSARSKNPRLEKPHA